MRAHIGFGIHATASIGSFYGPLLERSSERTYIEIPFVSVCLVRTLTAAFIASLIGRLRCPW
jgi:hypothetical protein